MKISMKKFSFLILSILFVLVGGIFLHLDIFVANADDQNQPTQISSTQDFVNHFSQSENLSKSYILSNNLNFEDIDLSDVYSNWTNFTGTFDGDGHTISNLTLSSTKFGNYGLFPSINGATIKNLKIDGNVKYDLSENPRNVGILVGSASSSHIENCEIGGLIEGEYTKIYSSNEEDNFSFETNYPINLGGIVGNLSLCEIKNCVVYFQTNLILSQDVDDELNFGGIKI